MRRAQQITSLNAQALRRLERLFRIADSTSVHHPDTDLRCGYVVLELHNLWSQYWREWYFSAVLCAATNRHNRPISPFSLVDEEAAGIAALAVVNPAKHSEIISGLRTFDARRDEPHWFDAKLMARLFSTMKFNDEPDFVSLLSFDSDFFDYLPALRNYYAHKYKGTWSRLHGLRRFLGLAHTPKASTLVLSPHPTSRDRLAINWIAKLSGSINAFG